jgi:AbrB family looped-hinge helix DNA binding protein
VGKVTSKLQVTVPKAIADEYGIHPGDDIEWVPAGEALRVVLAGKAPAIDRRRRLRLFDAATERQRARQAEVVPHAPRSRGWAREELYVRGRSG